MARGNWQRRIELTDARRAAAKLKKENRRSSSGRQRSNSTASAGGGGMGVEEQTRRLGGWLDGIGRRLDGSVDDKDDDVARNDDADADDDKHATAADDEEEDWPRKRITRKDGADADGGAGADADADADAMVAVDIWTDSRPANRREYGQMEDDAHRRGDDDDYENNDIDDWMAEEGKSKPDRAMCRRRSKGKAHPNANNRRRQECNIDGSGIGRDRSSSFVSLNDAKRSAIMGLCAKDFFLGRDGCCSYSSSSSSKQAPQRRQKGRRGRGDSIGGVDDGNEDREVAVDGGCRLVHYHQLPKSKGDVRGGGGGTTTTSSRQISYVPSHSTPMTLSQVLNEKHRSHRRPPPSGGTVPKHHARPIASLPSGIRSAVLESSYRASPVATMAAGTTTIANDDADAGSCIDMVYHTRFHVRGVYALSTCGGGGATASNVGVNDRVDDDDDDNDDDNDDDDDDDDDGDDSGRVDAVNDNDDDENENEVDMSRVHRALCDVLDEDGLSMTSIVYLAIRGVLIYDRYRGGLVVTEDQERFLLYGDPIEDVVASHSSIVGGKDHARRLGKEYDDSDFDTTERSTDRMHERLTHHILDEILSYSDEACVAVLPQVCSYWRDEVGTRSPQLWKTLLKRRGWPMPGGVNGTDDTNDENDDGTKKDSPSYISSCRKFFVYHYTVARDIRAVASAIKHISRCGGGGGSCPTGGVNNCDKRRLESAVQIFKGTKGAPVLERDARENQCFVKIWSEGANEDKARPRALALYKDCTLRLFEVVRGGNNIDGVNNVPVGIICRQLVCLRIAPPSVSRKKDTCEVMSVALDDRVVASLVEESLERNELIDLVNPWMTVVSREDVVCAGNEGLLEDDSLISHDLRGVILDHLLSGATEHDIVHQEMRDAMHDYLASYDGETSDVLVSVRPKLVACARGFFLFSAFICIPPSNFASSRSDDDDDISVCGHRLFLFSTGTGTVVRSFHLDRNRDGTNLFSSRPFKSENSTGSLFTNVLVSGPTMALSFLSVEIKRDSTADIIKMSMIENEDFAPWSTMNAALTSSHAVFTTDPQGSCPLLHIQRLSLSPSDVKDNVHCGFSSIEIGGPHVTVQNLFVIHEHYVAVVVKEDNRNEMGEFDGHWFGSNESSFVAIVFHIPTREEIHRCPIPAGGLSVDCLGDTLAMNVSNLGFAITGGNARDVARVLIKKHSETPLKTPKGKKKRLASIASGRKKDGFARGMSLRG